jgi:hypothetical protein
MKMFGLFNLSDKTQRVVLIALLICLVIGLGYALYMLFGRVNENFQNTSTTTPTGIQTKPDITYNTSSTIFLDSNSLFWMNYQFAPSTNTNEKYLLTSAKSSIFANPIPFFSNTNFIKCIPYFSVFDIARVIPWQSGSKDPKIISTNNPYGSYKGFTAFRPSTDATGNYETMGDLLIQIYAKDNASGLLSTNNSTVASTVGYNGYVRFNTNYLGPKSAAFSENSTYNVFWNDDGTTGGNNCLAASKTGTKWGNSILAKWGGNFNFLKQSTIGIGSTTITSDPRNRVYDTLNEAKFNLLANIGFNKMTDNITLPTLTNAPEKCETYITLNNNYFKVDSQNKNAITLESNIALASKFYINFATKPTADTASNINILYSSEPGSYKYDYVIGFDAINSDSKLSTQLEYATLKAYPIGTTSNPTQPLTHGTTANLAIIPDVAKTAMNKDGLYHNLGRAFCTFELTYNDSRENMALKIPSYVTGKDPKLTRIIAPYPPADSNSLSNKTLCITSDTSVTYPISLKAPTYPTNLKESDIVSELQSLYITSGGKPTPLTINVAPTTALVPDLKPVIMFLHNEIISITGKSGLRAFKIYPPNTDTPYINIRADGSINLDKDPSYYIASYDNTLKGVKLLSRYGRNSNGCVGLEDYTSDIWFSPYIDAKPTMVAGYNKLYNESVVYRLAFAPEPELIPNANDKDRLEYGYLNADQPPKILFKKEIGQEPTKPEESPRIFITYVNDDPKLALNDVLLSAGIQQDPKTPSKLTPMKIKWLNNVVEETVFESIPLDVSNDTLDARNTADNTGSVRQYFQNMVRYRLKPGTIPETLTVEAYMINGVYVPINNIVLKAFIPAPTTTAAAAPVAAETTIGQTAAQSNSVPAAQPTAKASNAIPQATTAPPTSTQAPEPTPTVKPGVVVIPLGGSGNRN